MKNIVRELNNEKVDIIRWSADTKEFVLEALCRLQVKSVTLDDSKKSILIKVDEDQLSLAIGKRGQNARLTSRLTGWDINIEQDKSVIEDFNERVGKAAKVLVEGVAADRPGCRSFPGQGRLGQPRYDRRSRAAGYCQCHWHSAGESRGNPGRG